MFSLIFKIAIAFGLFSMIPAEAVNNFVPGVSEYHETSIQVMGPVVEAIKGFLSGDAKV